MLDHLDDPEPFVPSDGFRSAVVARGRRRRRWQRLAVSGSAAAVVLFGAVAAGAIAVDRRDAAIDRTTITSTPSTDGATNVLVVGTDDDGRADTMAVVRLDGRTLRILSVPRDLWNPAAHDRLNGSWSEGPDQLVDDVTTLTGVPLDHYVQLDVHGFVDLTDAVGGIRARVDRSIRDATAGLDLPAADCTSLDGETLLALVRSRHLEVQRDRGWVVDATGDFGRMARSRVVLSTALQGFIRHEGGIESIDRLSQVLADHAVVDDGLDLGAIRELGRRLLDADPTIVGETLPVYDDNVDGNSVLRPAAGAADVTSRFGAAPGDQESVLFPVAGPHPFVGLGPC